MVFQNLRSGRGTSSDSRTGEGGWRRRYTAFSRLLLLPEIPSAPGRETPCPLNGVTGLPWLRGTPWNWRHRRAQRKAHLFWKNIIRTRARHEPHQGRCSPALASLFVHGLTLCTRWECKLKCSCVFRRDDGDGLREGNPPRGTDCQARESDEKSSTWSQKSRVSAPRWSFLATFAGEIDSVYYLASGERLTYASSVSPCFFD